jgi:predicted molibdopterin-dependent oxidoreductase YjgC
VVHGRVAEVVVEGASALGKVDVTLDRSLTVHPADARVCDVADGDRVLVDRGDATVETAVTVSDAVRRGVVHFDASVADTLVRGGDPSVRLRPPDEPNGDEER